MTRPFAVPSPSAPPRLCARQVPFRLKPDWWFPRRGSGAHRERNASSPPSSRLCGFAALPTLSVHRRKRRGKAAKPQSRKGGTGSGRIETIRTGPHCTNLCDPEPPFQGFGATLSRIRGAMPRAVLGRPVGAGEAKTERERHPLFASSRLCVSPFVSFVRFVVQALRVNRPPSSSQTSLQRTPAATGPPHPPFLKHPPHGLRHVHPILGQASTLIGERRIGAVFEEMARNRDRSQVEEAGPPIAVPRVHVRPGLHEQSHTLQAVAGHRGEQRDFSRGGIQNRSAPARTSRWTRSRRPALAAVTSGVS